MHDADVAGGGVALEHAADVHQATDVAGGHDLGPAADDVVFLALPMASDVPGIFTLKVPPKPQHSSMFGSSQ